MEAGGVSDGIGEESLGVRQHSSPSLPVPPCWKRPSVHASHRLLRGSLTFCLIVSPCRAMQGGLGQCDSEP